MKITIVVPVFNEEKNVALMHSALGEVFKKLSYAMEIIFVDDGSTDNTWGEVARAAAKDKRIKGIGFTRNFGKEAALEVALKESSGEAVVILDGDLQHPPEVIPKLVEEWKRGVHIVRTKRVSKIHPGFLKKVSSFFFYRLLNIVSDTPMHPGYSDFCLLDRKVVEEINALPEKQKFHRLLTHWVGFKSTSIPYEVKERAGGKSTYTFRKLFSLARNAIVSSSTLPMTIIFLVGCALVVLGVLLVSGLMLYKFFVDWEYIGAAAVLAAFIVLNNGVLMITLGIMSLYQIAIYREVQNRPSYIVRETIN